MSSDTHPTPEREAFLRAEEKLWSHYGLDVRPRELDLPRPKLRARVLECGAGDPVVYIHGGGGFASHFAPLLPEVPGFRNLAFDRPGCGLTDGFLYRGVRMREHAVEFLDSLLDALEIERAPIVGNSMGGLWALSFALARPERVSALALLGSPALAPERGSRIPVFLRVLASPTLSAVMARLAPEGGSGAEPLRWIVGEPALQQMPPEMIACWGLGMQISGAQSSLATMMESLLTLRGPRRGVGIGEPELAKVAQPTLLVWGSRDGFAGIEVAERVASLVPDAQLEMLDAGHMPWLDEPKHCGELIRGFLEEHRAAGSG